MEWEVGGRDGVGGSGRGLLPRGYLCTPKALLSICGTLTHWTLMSECDLGAEATSLALERVCPRIRQRRSKVRKLPPLSWKLTCWCRV